MSGAETVARLLARGYNEWIKEHGPDADGAYAIEGELRVVKDGTVYQVDVRPVPGLDDRPREMHRSCGLLNCTDTDHLVVRVREASLSVVREDSGGDSGPQPAP